MNHAGSLFFNYYVSNLFSSCEGAGESFGESFPLTLSLSLLMYLVTSVGLPLSLVSTASGFSMAPVFLLEPLLLLVSVLSMLNDFILPLVVLCEESLSE